MGGCNSSSSNAHKTYISRDPADMSQGTYAPPEWKYFLPVEVATKKYRDDGSLPDGFDLSQLELRAILDDPLSQKVFGKYLKETSSLNVFSCWIAIQEFKVIPSTDFRKSTSRHIYNKFIKEGAILEIIFLTAEERNEIKNIVYSNFGESSETLTSTCFNSIQIKCFMDLYSTIFVPFKSSRAYRDLTVKIKKQYNRVTVTDFDYFEKLGEGGFGAVIHVRKKSTRKHCAMKILHKLSLLEYYSDDPTAVTFEKQAFAALQHPFIVNLDYAFQTKSLAFLVMDLLMHDLSKELRLCPNYCMDPVRVQFYASEVLLALSHMHQMGLIYRDLKPSNILLSNDGHIQLVDLGCAMFNDMEQINQVRELNDKLPLLHSRCRGNIMKSTDTDVTSNTCSDENTAKANEHSHDAIFGSYVGTIGYIAPEIVLQRSSLTPIVYKASVDFWSFGVTIFRLLTGKLPFTDAQLNALMSSYQQKEQSIKMSHSESSLSDSAAKSTAQAVKLNGDIKEAYVHSINGIQFPSFLPPTTVDFLSKLLDLNETTRLGSAGRGATEIKMHPFFRGVDWEMMEQKMITPPYKPVELTDPLLELERSEPITLNTSLELMDKSQWNKYYPDEASQMHFNNWDFISHKTLKVECGIANELEQFDKSFKVRQMMGDKNDIKSMKKGWFS